MRNHGQPCFPKTGHRPRKWAWVVRRIIKWGVITAAGILLFLWGKSYALHWRGYKAAGGEIAFLFLPLLWGIIQSNIKATREAVKADE